MTDRAAAYRTAGAPGGSVRGRSRGSAATHALAQALAIASGALVVASAPPFAWSWLAWVALVPLQRAIDLAATPAAALVAGACTGLVMAIGVDYGLLGYHRGMFALVLVVVTSVVGGIAGATKLLARPDVPAPLRALVMPTCWVLGERLSAALGTPWALALTQTEHLAVVQSASVVGILGVSFLLVLVNVGVYSLLRRWGSPLSEPVVPALAFLALGVDLAYGWRSLATRGAPGPAVQIAAVQPVLPSDAYTFQGLNRDYRRLLRTVVAELSTDAAAARPGLLVWSEGGNGQFNFRVPALRRELGDLARRSGSTLLLSSYDLDAEGRLFNSVFAVSPEGRLLGRYDKVHLTPVGESDYDAGAALTPLPTPIGPVGALVCFESCFPGPARTLTAAGAVVLLVTASDAAFGDTSLPLLHGRFAVFRAVENGRPLVHAANTGPSFLVSPAGEITAALPLSSRAVLRGTVTPRREATLYTRWGDAPVLVLAAVVLAASVRCRRRADREHVGEASGVVVGLLGLTVAAAAGVGVATGSLALMARQVPALGGDWRRLVRSLVAPPGPVIPSDAGREFLQARPNTCGVAALAYLLTYLGMDTREADLLPLVPVGQAGASMASLAAAARARGLAAWGEWQTFESLRGQPKPIIAHITDDHYVVVQSVQPDGTVEVFDPATGYVRIREEDFRRRWRGYVLVVRFADIPADF